MPAGEIVETCPAVEQRDSPVDEHLSAVVDVLDHGAQASGVGGVSEEFGANSSEACPVHVRRRRDRDQQPAWFEHLKRLRLDFAADGVDHDVDVGDHSTEVRRRVADHVVGAEFEADIDSRARSGRVGLVTTWYFNVVYIAVDGGVAYLADWFANAASSSAAVDVVVTAIVACVFYVREIWRLGCTRWALVLVPLTFAVALAVTLPLFLAFRELTLLRRGAAVEQIPPPVAPQTRTTMNKEH